jgi:uncharacterized protein (DUF2249 family)
MSITTDVVTTITRHHGELQAELSARVDDVVAAVRDGRPHEPAVARLTELLATDVVPHARAEEDVLYAVAVDDPLRPLVQGMLFEHETLLALTAELGAVGTGVDAAAIARALREVFVGHVRRENELLLPALAADPAVDLAALLPAMQARFTAYRGAARVLDVREEPPARRHVLIFETYDATPPGDAFVLVNDHDPKPLRYQFEAEQAERFTWDYLEQGPDVWRVRIGRR